jgi:hypothetical protein
MEEKMMTKLEFEDAVNAWGEKVKIKMKAILSSNTHGKGALAKSLKVIVAEDTKTTSHSVSFKFHHYGVFRTYGVGRGWKHIGDKAMRVTKVQKGSVAENLLKQRGYTKKDMAEYVIGGKSKKERTPLDWFDSAIREDIYELGDIASHYYADFSMENLLDTFNRMTISSNYKLIINGKQ